MKKADAIYRKTAEFIKSHDMILEGDHTAAGVSGGADSVAMLHILSRLRQEIPFSLYAVHVHHGIRKEEADRDAEFVRSLCGEWEIPMETVRFSVPELAEERRQGLEETGRQVRREALFTYLDRLKVSPDKQKCALAHQKEDVAETLIHNLARGTGIFGLSSIRPVSGKIIRPVLCLSREEIMTYLEENGIGYVTDSTNESDAYTRNRIRHHILPLLKEEVNPKAVDHLCQAARMAEEAAAYLQEKGRERLEACPRGEKWILLDDALFKAPEAEKTTTVLLAAESLLGGRKDFTASHVEQILSLGGRQVGRRLNLPGSLRASRVYEGVLLSLDRPAVKDETVLVLPVPGEVETVEYVVRTRLFSWSGQKIVEKKYTKWLDYDKINDTLVLRRRKPGDYMEIGQRPHRKKLARVLIDDKIPERERDSLLLLAEGNRILVTSGGRMSDCCKVTQDTKNVLEISFQRIGDDGKEQEENG